MAVASVWIAAGRKTDDGRAVDVDDAEIHGQFSSWGVVWSQDRQGILNYEPINTVRAFADCSGGVGIVADAAGATVIFLQSHPAWAAARRRDRERRDAMRRHPSFVARRRAAAAGGQVTRDFKVYSSTDTPA